MSRTGVLEELESMRTQVSELARELAERDRTIDDLRNIMDTVPDFLFTLDHRKQLIKWNKRAVEATGYTPQELFHKPALDFVPKEEQDRTAAAIRQAFTEGYAELDGHLLTKEGRRIPYHWTGAALKNSQGDAIGIAGMGRDVSEQKRAEEALRVSEGRLRLAMETAHMGAWDWNIPANRATYSHTLSPLLGLPPGAQHATLEEFLGSIHPEDRGRIGLAITQSVETGVPFCEEYRILWPDNSLHWVSDRGQVYQNHAGQPIRMIGVVLDITERKQAEDALRHREQDLRNVLDERERLSQNLHDGILQSLYAIGLGLESCKPLMRHRKHEKVSELLEQAIDQMNRVMGEIRNFIAGLDSGMLSGDTFSSALHAVIHAITATQPLHCTVTIDDAAAGRVSAEQALHMVNIVREALSNSLRHGQATKASVSLKQLAHSLRLCISDNGHGFNPPSVQGVGHGLTNMAARAHKIGARFSIRSAHGRGTRILVNLP